MKNKTNFKENEIGNILEDWEEVIFSEVIEINPLRELKKGVKAKFVSMADLLPFQRKISNFIIREYKGGSKFRNKDTLMARITPCLENGKTAYVDVLDDTEIGFGSTEFIILSPKENKVDNKFVYYSARSPEIRNIAIKSMTGTSGRQRVESEIFDNILISLPPLKEQKAIVKILSDLDDKIELNKEMNKILEEIGQVIFKHWFIDFEFPNEKGNPYKSSGSEMVESEFGEIPKGWIIGTLKNVLSSLESGSRPKGGISLYSEGIPSIGAENILGLGKYDYSKTKYVPIEYFGTIKTGIVKNGDVLLYKDGAQLGRKSLFMYGFPFEICCINEHVFILRTNERICPSYLYFWLDQSWMTDAIINLNTNSAQPGINQEGVKSLSILIPSSDMIKKYNDFAESLLTKIFKNCLESNNLTKIRDSLLPKLMSGQIRIK